MHHVSQNLTDSFGRAGHTYILCSVDYSYTALLFSDYPRYSVYACYRTAASQIRVQEEWNHGRQWKGAGRKRYEMLVSCHSLVPRLQLSTKQLSPYHFGRPPAFTDRPIRETATCVYRRRDKCSPGVPPIHFDLIN